MTKIPLPHTLRGMKALGRSKHWISPEDYLEGELHSELHHEYFAGEGAHQIVGHDIIHG